MPAKFTLDRGTVTIAVVALDPFYADMKEGESFFVDGDSLDLMLPLVERRKLPTPAGPQQAISRWAYEHAMSGGDRWRVTKLSTLLP